MESGSMDNSVIIKVYWFSYDNDTISFHLEPFRWQCINFSIYSTVSLVSPISTMDVYRGIT